MCEKSVISDLVWVCVELAFVSIWPFNTLPWLALNAWFVAVEVRLSTTLVMLLLICCLSLASSSALAVCSAVIKFCKF